MHTKVSGVLCNLRPEPNRRRRLLIVIVVRYYLLVVLKTVYTTEYSLVLLEQTSIPLFKLITENYLFIIRIYNSTWSEMTPATQLTSIPSPSPLAHELRSQYNSLTSAKSSLLIFPTTQTSTIAYPNPTKPSNLSDHWFSVTHSCPSGSSNISTSR